jgi:hypothetical protein
VEGAARPSPCCCRSRRRPLRLGYRFTLTALAEVESAGAAPASLPFRHAGLRKVDHCCDSKVEKLAPLPSLMAPPGGPAPPPTTNQYPRPLHVPSPRWAGRFRPAGSAAWFCRFPTSRRWRHTRPGDGRATGLGTLQISKWVRGRLRTIEPTGSDDSVIDRVVLHDRDAMAGGSRPKRPAGGTYSSPLRRGGSSPRGLPTSLRNHRAVQPVDRHITAISGSADVETEMASLGDRR